MDHMRDREQLLQRALHDYAVEQGIIKPRPAADPISAPISAPISMDEFRKRR